jgi:hypothetical protein
MKIDSYSFGKIVIDGKTYRSDVIIYPNRIKTDWYRIKGHEVSPSDIEEIIEAKPNLLIIGTGAYGLVKISEETKELLSQNNIKLIAKPTKEACEEYNRSRNEKVITGLHLTC